MRVVVVNHAYDPAVTEPERTLAAFAALRTLASGLRRAGLDVGVVQRYGRDADLRVDGVAYRFVADGPRGRPRAWRSSDRVARAVAAARPDVVHVNGLVFPVPTRALRARLGPVPAIVLQHHAESPAKGPKRAVQRWGLGVADGFLFTAAAQAQPWRAARVIPRSAPVFEVMEGATGLVPPPRAEARAHRPLPGAPALLWVGRLHEVKDPLTLLAGLELLLGDVPTAHLTMVFGEAGLAAQVSARIAASPRLRDAVTLVGRVPHDELGWYFGSADYFVAASLREGSGFALAEALACGAVPIVTDIPSFARMTAGGRLGGLWRAGDPESFARVARQVFERPREALSRAAVEHFQAHLSSDAIGRDAGAAYEAVVAHRTERSV